MDREKLLRQLEQRYISKRELMQRIPLGIHPDSLWQDLVVRRRAKGTILPLHGCDGDPYWYVTTGKMVAASEKIVAALYENDAEFDPYVNAPVVSNLEEVFYTSYVEGSQLTLQDAMAFLQSDLPPRDMEEQIIVNNRIAGNYAGSNLHRDVDEEMILELNQILTDGLDGCGTGYRMEDWIVIPSMGEEPYDLPPAFAIPDRMSEYLYYLSDPMVHPLIKASVAQAWILAVRPFPEGNERLGRLLSTMVLLRSGYTFFSDVSLSALIARKSYGYYEAIANILRRENNGDMTYFMEYYLELLSRAVDERRMRIRKREEQNRAAELELAHTTLTPPASMDEPLAWADPSDSGADETLLAEQDMPAQLVMKDDYDVEIAGEIQYTDEDKHAVKRILKQLEVENKTTLFGKASKLLRTYLETGKMVFTTGDLQDDFHMSQKARSSFVIMLRERSAICQIGKDRRFYLYRFCTAEEIRENEREVLHQEQLGSPREVLAEMVEQEDTLLGQCAKIVSEFIQAGVHEFEAAALFNPLQLRPTQISSSIAKMKQARIITKEHGAGKKSLYRISDLCFLDHDEDVVMEPVLEDEYDPEIYDRIDLLADADMSQRDKRVGSTLRKFLPQGVVSMREYMRETGASDEVWNKDMRLATQMGILEKENSQSYRFLRKAKPQPPELSNAQRRVARAIYDVFGDGAFSSDMVVASLGYSDAHIAAFLHRFTLIKILECFKGDVYQYQFLVNPEDNPECFSESA